MAGRSVVVVIATYRRPDHVRTCLEHLADQTLTPDRVVVVDASPDDLTRAVVAAFPGVEYRRNELGAGSTATSRAIGIAGAHEEIVAFLDDDAYARPEWLEILLEPFDDPSVAAVGGRADNGRPEEESEGLGEIGLLLPSGKLTGFFAADPGVQVDIDHMLGANMSLRLDVIAALGGIRDLYPGTCLREETDIALRVRKAGYRIVYEPRALVRHVAGTYAKGRRFDLRYRFYGTRNHVVLMSSVFGWRHTITWRACRSMLADAVAGTMGAARSGLGRSSDLSLAARGRRVGGGAIRSVVDLAGVAAGALASVRRVDRARGLPLPVPTPSQDAGAGR